MAILGYAAAKFAGAQVVTSGGILDKPVADLSGINLTWVYFGHSPLYANFAAALLTFDRKARLGAAVMLPITANIVAVNFGFRIGTETAIASSILLVLNLYLLAWDLPAWKRFLWNETSDDPTRPNRITLRVSGALKGFLLVALVAGLYWLGVAPFTSPGPTPRRKLLRAMKPTQANVVPLFLVP